MAKIEDMIVKLTDVEGVKKDPPRVSRLLLSEKNAGLQNVSMGVNVCEAGSMIPEHSHQGEEEAMYLISGQAKLYIEGEEFDISSDTAFCVPQGAKHKVVNTGDEPFKLLWVYSPPLPSHRKE